MKKILVPLLVVILIPSLVFALACETIEDKLARAFSEMTLPNFEQDHPQCWERVAVKMQAFFGISGLRMKKEKVEELQQKVQERSAGKVRLELADPSEFKNQIRGAAEYFILIRGEERKRVIVAPQDPPCKFD